MSWLLPVIGAVGGIVTNIWGRRDNDNPAPIYSPPAPATDWTPYILLGGVTLVAIYLFRNK